MVPRLQHGPRWQHRPQAVTRSSMVTEAMDINKDPDRGPEDTMAPGGSARHSDQHGLSSGSTPIPQHCHRWQSRTWASLWPLVATWAMNINTDPSCGRTTDPDMVLGHHHGLGCQAGCPHQCIPHHLHLPRSASLHRARTILPLSPSTPHPTIHFFHCNDT